MEDQKPIKIKEYVACVSFLTPITVFGWGHVKDNGKVYIGRHRARCTAPALGFGPEKCNRKLDLTNIGAYYPRVKQIHCKICADLVLWHESFENELVFVQDKKTMEEQIVDKLVEDRII